MSEDPGESSLASSSEDSSSSTENEYAERLRHIDATTLDQMHTDEQLKTLLRLFVDAVNRQDLNPQILVWSRLAPDFTGRIDSLLTANGPADLLDMYTGVFEQNPNMEVVLTELVPCVGEKRDEAVLFWTATAKGMYDNLTICSTGTVGFRNVEGQWFITTFEGVRGFKDLAP